MSVNEPHFVFYLQYSNKNTVTKLFFNADMAEHFRLKLQLLDAEIQAPGLLTFFRITPYCIYKAKRKFRVKFSMRAYTVSSFWRFK